MEDGNESIALYLHDVHKKFLVLNKQDELETAKLAKEGNKVAIEKLVLGNLRFVINIAKKYQGRGLPLEDLISEGNVGLLLAINRFEAERGYRFITYAVWWIRQAIIKAIHEKVRMICPPDNKFQLPENVSLFDDINFEPDYEDDFPGRALNSVLRDELERYIDLLDNRTAGIIRYRFGFGDRGCMTLKSVGKVYNLCRERVRHIQNNGIKQLRWYVKNHTRV